MEKRLLLWLIPLLLLPLAHAAPEACMSMTLHGFLLDTDCDGVHDQVDNCPLTPTAAQYDSNRDGIGDHCDLLIEEVMINPSVLVRASEFFSIQVMIINNQPAPLYGVQIEADNTQLDIEGQTNIPELRAGESYTTEFLLKIPRCTAEKEYPLRVTTRYYSEGREHIEQTTEKLRVVPGGLCDEPESVLENSIIETFYERDLDIGETAVIPFKVLNMNDNAVTYTVYLEGLDTWATYRFEPEPTFTLPAGHEVTGYLTIELEKWAPLGRNDLDVVVVAEGDIERFPVKLFITERITSNQWEQTKQALEVTLILFVFILIIAGFIIAYKKANEEPETNQDHRYLEEVGVDKVEDKK